MGVEGAEEALETAWRVAGIEDAGVAGLPGDEAEEEGEGDGEPGPEDGWGVAGPSGSAVSLVEGEAKKER